MEIHIIQGSTHALACLTPAKFINIYVADCVRFALNFTGHYAKVCINCKLGWVGVKIRFIYIYIYRYEYEFSIYIYMYYRKWRYIFEMMLICKPHLKLSFIKTWCYSHERNVKLHSISLFSTWNATYLPLQNPKTKRTQKAFLLRAVLICTERPIFVMVVCNIFTCLKICPHTSPRPLWMISRLYIFVELNVIHQKLCSISPWCSICAWKPYIYIYFQTHIICTYKDINSRAPSTYLASSWYANDITTHNLWWFSKEIKINEYVHALCIVHCTKDWGLSYK